MDRLICGDVGFGKTEVALRAAFVVAMAGRQVAILAPTTLLVRQHFQVMRERFAGPAAADRADLALRAGQAGGRDPRGPRGRRGRHRGRHPRAARQDVSFKDLGLVVIDEEQHFGVVHKERLKQLRAEVHVLTMTATPIPRTLQMALGGPQGAEPDRHPAGRPPGGARLRAADRPGGAARGDPARALPRRPDLLRLPADRGPGRSSPSSSASWCPRSSSASPTAACRPGSSRT